MKKYRCNCCGYYTLKEKPMDPKRYPGTFEICPVCQWEDDSLQYLNPDCNYGANGVSLNQAKLNFKSFGSIRKDLLKYARKPLADELQ